VFQVRKIKTTFTFEPVNNGPLDGPLALILPYINKQLLNKVEWDMRNSESIGLRYRSKANAKAHRVTQTEASIIPHIRQESNSTIIYFYTHKATHFKQFSPFRHMQHQ
jgi:hypothetical protein